MKNFFFIIFSLVFVANLSAQNRDFKIFNAMLYNNMPKLDKYGIENIDVIYELELLSFDPKDRFNRKKRFIDRPKIRTRVAQEKLSSQYVCLDIENWNTRIRQGGQESKAKYLDVLSLVKSVNKSNKFGYFGVVPFHHYIEDYHKGNKKNAKLLNDWKTNNEFLKEIYEEVDVFFPIFYNNTTNLNAWEEFVKSQVDMVRSVNKTKPIYGFVWPQYFTPTDSKMNYRFIDGNTWYKQLEILKKYCNGIVIWGAPKYPDKKNINWNENWEWWQSTLRFINNQ